MVKMMEKWRESLWIWIRELLKPWQMGDYVSMGKRLFLRELLIIVARC